MSCRFVQGTVNDRGALIDAGIETCDSVLLCAHDDGEALSKTHDAHAMAAVSLIKKLREEGPEGAKGPDGKSMHMVTFVNYSATVAALEILAHRSTANITIGSLIPDQLLGGIMAQVGTSGVARKFTDAMRFSVDETDFGRPCAHVDF